MLAEDQRRNPPFGTNLTYPLAAYCRLNQTSATTHGSPLRWLDTAESWQWMLDNWKQVYRAAGVLPSDRLYFAFSFGPFWDSGRRLRQARRSVALRFPGGGLSSLARLEAMRDTAATVLLCTPTYAMRLAEVAAAENLDLSTLCIRKILVAGEPGGSVLAVRECIERRWSHAAIFDHHGMTEVGPVSYQCPEEPGTLVVMESSYLAEVVDPATGRPVEQGAIGELVLTTLGRIGSPLLRYRTGDLVREDVGMAARHGRSRNVPERRHPGTDRRHGADPRRQRLSGRPRRGAALLREVAEYRVELQTRRAMTEIHIRVEPIATGLDGPALARQIQAKVRSLFNLRMRVTVCPPGTLPRFEMKAQRWVREVVARVVRKLYQPRSAAGFDVLTSHPSSVIRGQPRRHSGNVFGLAQATEGGVGYRTTFGSWRACEVKSVTVRPGPMAFTVMQSSVSDVP